MRKDDLAAGLAALGERYSAQLCDGCHGAGETRQMYTIGCGMGSYESMGPCSWCGSTGLLQGGKAAPASIVNQVMLAGIAADRPTAQGAGDL